MDRLDDLAAFLAIVERGSQTAAARHLRRSLQSVGRSLATLERGLGVALLRRTTRRSAPTDAGFAFYRGIKPALAAIDEARREASGRRAEPSGLLRVSAPVLFAPAYVAPVVCAFMQRYPQVEVELRASDRPVDLFEDGLDLAVRIRHMPDSALRARRLGDMRVVAFGAPGYFAKHGRPRHPDELAQHQCILRTGEPGDATWPFRVGGKRKDVRVSGRFRTDSAASMHAVAARGLAIARAPLWQIRSLVDRGEVEIVLADFEAPRLPIHAVWPPSRVPVPKTRLFADMLAAQLKRAAL